MELTWIQPTSLRTRFIFNTWRKPFPYLFHRWDVQGELGWVAGFWFYSSAQKYLDKYAERT